MGTLKRRRSGIRIDGTSPDIVRAVNLWTPMILVSLVAACGGASHAHVQDNPRQNSGIDVSVGESAIAAGGIAALGHAKNGSQTSESRRSALQADLVDSDSPVKLDGLLQEWPARTLAKVIVKGSARDKLAFAAAVQYDDTSIYIAGEVTDSSFFRTSRFGEGEDHASLILAIPSASNMPESFAAYEIGLFAGKPGEMAGEVRLLAGGAHGEVRGSKIAEAQALDGYTFEASLPWSTFPEARVVRVGLRAAVRYIDSDKSGSAKTIVSTGAGDATNTAALPELLTEPEQSIVAGLFVPRGIALQAPKADLIVDVTGDAMKERVSVFDRFFTICGPHYRGGKEYFFRDLNAELVRLEARNLTGRGKDDLVLRRRFSTQGATREWFEVWSILGGDEPVTTFGHEIAITRDGKHVDNAVHVAGRTIDVSIEPASGWDPKTYREPMAIDVEPVLLPWGAVRTQSFRFDGAHFAKTSETKQAPNVAAGLSNAQDSATATLIPEEPRTPTVRAGGDLSAQVFAQYRRDHHVASDAKPKVDLSVQVGGDARPEHVVLMGRDIVVFGPGFKGGNQYAVMTLQQFSDPSDIHEMVARDLTGDGAADLIVRGVRHIGASDGGDAVNVDAMFIYQVKGDTLTRIFAVETTREQAGKRVQGLVQFVPSRNGRTFDIVVRPGRAIGWTEKTYTWGQEQPGTGAIEPLLLPWGKIPGLTYQWNGEAFVR